MLFLRRAPAKFAGSRNRILARSLSSQVESLDSSLPKPRLNYRRIKENALYVSHNAFNRKSKIPVGTVATVVRLYDEHTALSSQLNRRRAEQAEISEVVRQAQGNERTEAVEMARTLKKTVHELEARLHDLDSSLLSSALLIPNDSHPLTPIGAEEQAEVLSTHGPPPLPTSPDRDHVKISSALGLLDLEAGSTVTGASWYFLKNEAALLELSLVNYAMSIALKHGFTPTLTPDVVKADVAYRCGFQPRDSHDGPSQNYHLERSGKEPQLILSGTAEIPLAGAFAQKLYEEKALPLRAVGLGRAFRAEAGARGTDTKGLYRVHQFTKVELFAVTSTDKSEGMMEEIKDLQIEIFHGLGFPFRVLDMPSEELGASAYRKYDMEAWMPGRGKWGEISSTSNCTDYQSRRLHIRYQPGAPASSASPALSPEKYHPLPFAHTLNGTAMAVPRILIALLENGVRFGGSGEVVGLDLPRSLKQFWIGGESERIRWV